MKSDAGQPENRNKLLGQQELFILILKKVSFVLM
jgi:hypothetical protein